MVADVDPAEVAAALRASLGLVFRRLRQAQPEDRLTFAERSVLSRLERGGASTAAELARLEQITPQSMGTTLAALEARAFVERRRDPNDGRRIVVAVTKGGRQALRDRRSARNEQLARVLEAEFTTPELKRLLAAAPLLERLGERL